MIVTDHPERHAEETTGLIHHSDHGSQELYDGLVQLQSGTAQLGGQELSGIGYGLGIYLAGIKSGITNA